MKNNLDLINNIQNDVFRYFWRFLWYAVLFAFGALAWYFYGQEQFKKNFSDYMPDMVVIRARFEQPDPQIIEVPVCDEIPTAGIK